MRYTAGTRTVDRLTGAKKFLLLLPLVFFCVHSAHAQSNYYVGGCVAEVTSNTTASCTPTPPIPAGMAVAVGVRFDDNSGTNTLTDAGGNSYTPETAQVGYVQVVIANGANADYAAAVAILSGARDAYESSPTVCV